jgi:hypothetical protein
MTVFETLEQRQLLSSTSAGSGWPTAPFNGGSSQTTIYVNQKGLARINRQSVGQSPAFNGYNIYFDDPGDLMVQSVSSNSLDLALYKNRGNPDLISSGSHTQVHSAIPDDKRMFYVAVRAKGDTSSRNYTLQVNGAPAGYLEKIPISSRNYAGASGSDISSDNDYDFYSFKLPRPGNWIVKIIPDKHPSPRLDATMNIFDSHGRPVGGSYTKPIDRGGAGNTEQWIGVALKADAQYFVRVDGAGGSLGGYGISVQIAPNIPDLSISARNSRFIFQRSYSSSQPLTVRYAVGGSARPGVDYQMLSGTITIAANAESAHINVQSLLKSAGDKNKSVSLSLRGSQLFNLTSHYKATVFL